MKRAHLALGLLGLLSLPASAQTITTYVAPFRSSINDANPDIGNHVGVILNLQIWQTLQIPPTGPGRNTKGLTYWDVSSRPPTSFADADALAREAGNDSQIVLWGKTFPYGKQYLVQAFLSIRGRIGNAPAGKSIWSVIAPDGKPMSVDVPEWQVNFDPVALRPEILAELRDPAGLKIYSGRRSGDAIGFAGNSIHALEQYPDAAKVALPDGTLGWVRLPELSTQPSEIVWYTSGVMRIFRQDWSGAKDHFQKVLDISHAPLTVRVDSLLYQAVAADHMGEDPYPYIQKAYNLSPYSRVVVQYACLARLAQLARMSPAVRAGEPGIAAKNSLRDIVTHHRALFPSGDTWYGRVQSFVAPSK